MVPVTTTTTLTFETAVCISGSQRQRKYKELHKLFIKGCHYIGNLNLHHNCTDGLKMVYTLKYYPILELNFVHLMENFENCILEF